MKKLNLISLLLVFVGAICLIYNYFSVQPYLIDIDLAMSSANFDYEAYSAQRSMSDLLGLIGTSTAGLGTIGGLIVFFKAKNKGGLLSAVLGLAIGITGFLVAFARVI
jgi:hypothetical protein